MKKWMSVFLAVVLVAGLGAPAWAEKGAGKKPEKRYDRIVAYVDSVDVAGKTMTVTREENGEKRLISISAKAASKVHVGDRVRIKLKPGTNESAGVMILGPKPGAAVATAGTETAPATGAPAQSEAQPETAPAVNK